MIYFENFKLGSVHLVLSFREGGGGISLIFNSKFHFPEIPATLIQVCIARYYVPDSKCNVWNQTSGIFQWFDSFQK